jgi:SNF2 family DNA or RNA helicase
MFYLRLGSPDVIVQSDIPLLTGPITLKPYQVVGVNWLRLLHKLKLNGMYRSPL